MTSSGGQSSTPRLIGSITAVSGILSRPVEPGDDEWNGPAISLDNYFKYKIISGIGSLEIAVPAAEARA
jgi:hypothetical protein